MASNILNEEADAELDISDVLTPGFLEYAEKLNNRIIYLFGDVDTEAIANIIAQIHILEKRGEEDIEIVINSPGGYVIDCFALIDVMDSSPCDFKVTVLGIAASAACLIATNGTPGKRFAGKNSEFMFHEVVGVSEIRDSDLAYIQKETKRTQKKFNKIFSRNTGQTVPKINKIFYTGRQDRYMTAEEARGFGIIDKIMRTRSRKRK